MGRLKWILQNWRILIFIAVVVQQMIIKDKKLHFAHFLCVLFIPWLWCSETMSWLDVLDPCPRAKFWQWVMSWRRITDISFFSFYHSALVQILWNGKSAKNIWWPKSPILYFTILHLIPDPSDQTFSVLGHNAFK